MIIGHLPAGFLLGRALGRLRVLEEARPRTILGAAMLGAIFPDTDYIYSRFVDHGSIHHHLYWTHLPAFWAAVCAAALAAGVLHPRLRLPAAAWCFFAGVVSHLLCDSLIGDIYWLMPLRAEPFSLFEVPARHSPWILNFVLHWVFGLECVLALAAAIVAAGDIRRHRAMAMPRSPLGFLSPARR
jgi:inner membrane protein